MFFEKKMVGIDIGEYAIKIAEFSRSGTRNTLRNYAWAKTPEAAKNSPDIMGQTIREMMDEAGITTRKSFFTIPDTSYFCTSFEIPLMPEKEIAGAISYNASRYLTLPVSQVSLDWQVVSPARPGVPLRVFVTAVPNTVIDRYRAIAKKAGLTLIGLEAEAFSIAAALVPHHPTVVCIVDAGMKSSTMSVIEQAVVKESYTFAQEAKPLAESFSNHIRDVDDKFFSQDKKHVEEIYLTGGTSNTPGLKEALAKSMGKPVSFGNCFAESSYPSALKNALAEIAPLFAGATGAALHGLDL